MKKIMILLCTVFIMVSLAACGSSANNEYRQETTEQSDTISATVESEETNPEQNDDAARPEISNDLSATINTFCTSGGSSIDRSLSDLRDWYPELEIVDGKRLNDATKNDLKKFCDR